jgi:hypothetical protein
MSRCPTELVTSIKDLLPYPSTNRDLLLYLQEEIDYC